jgi:hypothetical protein
MLVLENLRTTSYPLSIFTNQVLLYIFKLKIKIKINNIYFILFFNDNFGFLKKFKIKGPLVQGF